MTPGVEFDDIGDHLPTDEGTLHPLMSHGLTVGNDEGIETQRHPTQAFQFLLRNLGDLVEMHITRTDIAVRTGNADDRLFKIAVFEPYRPEHRPVGGALYSCGHIFAVLV